MRCTISRSLLVTVYWSRVEDKLDDRNICQGLPLNVYYAPLLLRGRGHLVRNTAAEKDLTIAIQITLDQVSPEIQGNKNGQKTNFQQRLINVTKRLTSSGRMSQLRVYIDMKQTSAEFFSQKFEYQRCAVFRTQPNISDGIFLRRQLTAFSP